MVKSFLIVLKNLQQLQKKQLQKRTIQKTAEATRDLIGNKIADKITSVSKKSNNHKNNEDVEITA